MEKKARWISLVTISLLLLGATSCLFTGCGESKVTVLSFYSKDNQSAKEFEPTLEEMKKKYKDDVVFKHYDVDDPANKEVIDEYGIDTGTCTYLILDTEGNVKESFVGKPHESMFEMRLSSLIPRKDGDSSGTTQPSMPSQPTAPSSMPEIPGVQTQ